MGGKRSANGPGSGRPNVGVAAFGELITRETDECVLWPFAPGPNGYGRITLDGKRLYVHAVACASAHGPRPPGAEAAHDSHGRACIDRLCINPRHLRWATRLENEHDKALRGTESKGEGHPGARLTEQDVRDIRQLLQSGVRGVRVAERYGVGRATVSRIKSGQLWAHVV